MDPRIEELMQDPMVRALFDKIAPNQKPETVHDTERLAKYMDYVYANGPDGALETKEMLKRFGLSASALGAFARHVVGDVTDQSKPRIERMDPSDSEDVVALFLMGMTVGGRIIKELMEETERDLQEIIEVDGE